MSPNLFGFNIHGEMADKADNVGGKISDLINYLDKAKPKHTLILRNFGLALTLAKRYPAMTVHIRYWSNEGVLYSDGTYKIQPKAWLDQINKDWLIAKNQGIKNLSFYTVNEPRQLDKIAKWHSDLIKQNNQIGYFIPLTLINFGYYEPNEIPFFKEVLQLISNNPLYILGIHEYFTALPSSGMPELDANSKPFFPIPYDKWDRRENATRYHVGRHQFILKFCDDNQIKRPRIVITEFGADRLDEGGLGWVAIWLNSLKITPSYTNIRGWLSCWNQWLDWFRNWTVEQTYFYMVQYLAVRVFESNYLDKPRGIEGVLFFSWWNSGALGSAEDWTQFRVDKHYNFLNLIADYNNGLRLGLEAENEFQNPLPTDNRWEEFRIRSTNLTAAIKTLPSATISINSINRTWINLDLITFDKMSDNEKKVSNGEWFLIKIGNQIGWIKNTDFEVWVESNQPDFTEIKSLVASLFSQLTNARNVVITIEQEIEDLENGTV